MSNEQYFFNAEEWDISVWDCGWKPTTGDIKVTKKKPKSKLEWREITPHDPYYVFNAGKMLDSLASEEGYWQKDYRLVQFKITGGRTKEVMGKNIWTTGLREYSTYYPCSPQYAGIGLESDCANSWSAPVVVPIKFYEKLDCYVKEFNEKLNGGE